jgi:shikimate kinase
MILKLKRTPGIYLVGFMGSGKSAVGRLLAEALGWQFADLDADIEALQKMPITDIFETRGEAGFRRLETEALAQRVRTIESGTATVLALGGGAFAQQPNVELIADRGISIWLDCPVETAWQRVSAASHRPLARNHAEFVDLYAARRPYYSRADYRVEVLSDEPAIAVDAIRTLLKLQ